MVYKAIINFSINYTFVDNILLFVRMKKKFKNGYEVKIINADSKKPKKIKGGKKSDRV